MANFPSKLSKTVNFSLSIQILKITPASDGSACRTPTSRPPYTLSNGGPRSSRKIPAGANGTRSMKDSFSWIFLHRIGETFWKIIRFKWRFYKPFTLDAAFECPPNLMIIIQSETWLKFRHRFRYRVQLSNSSTQLFCDNELEPKCTF